MDAAGYAIVQQALLVAPMGYLLVASRCVVTPLFCCVALTCGSLVYTITLVSTRLYDFMSRVALLGFHILPNETER